jgi:hypothetical protein
MKNILLISFLLLFAGGELGRINPNQYLTIYLHDILIIAYLFLNLAQLKKIIKNFKKITNFNKKIFLLLFFNIFLATIYAIWQKAFILTSLLYLARTAVYFLFVFLLKKEFAQKKIIQIFLSASLIILGLGFCQYLFLPDLTSLYHLGFDDHFYRLTSTLLDPNFAGLLFVFNWLYYASQTKQNKKTIFLAIFFLIGIALTYSRASYLSLTLASGYLLLKNKKIKKLFIFLAITFFLFSIPFLPKKSGGEGVNLQRTSSIQARIISAEKFINKNQGLTVFIGKGPFAPQYQTNKDGLISHARFADNFLIFLYNSLGLFGGVLILILLIQESKKQIRRNNHFKISLLIALLTHSLFNNNITQAFISLLFWGLYL